MIVVQRDDTAYALDARNGGILWRVQGVGGPGLLGGASPAIDGQLAVIPFASGEVLGRAGAQRPHRLGHGGDRRAAATWRATTSSTSAATR